MGLRTVTMSGPLRVHHVIVPECTTGCLSAWYAAHSDVANREWSTHGHHGILPHQIWTLCKYVHHYIHFTLQRNK